MRPPKHPAFHGGPRFVSREAAEILPVERAPVAFVRKAIRLDRRAKRRRLVHRACEG